MKYLVCGFLCFQLILGVAEAQKLESFRKATSASSKSSSSKSKKKKKKKKDRDDDDDYHYGTQSRSSLGETFVVDPLLNALFSIPKLGSEASYLRATTPALEELSLGNLNFSGREPGDMLQPILRIDGGYQHVDDNTGAIDLRTEAGFGPIAAEWRGTWFTEELPDGGEDELALHQLMAKWRMAIGDPLEIGFGIGTGKTDAPDAEFDLATQLSMRYMYENRIGAEWRGAWIETEGSTISDQDLALLLGTNHIALRGGYRWIDAGGVKLNGPHIGLSFAW